MTIVLARRFNQRIVVLSDTMISDRDARAPNVFPGRLKSIVVNRYLTVSYAGLSSQAMDVIRGLRRRAPLTTLDAVSILLDAHLRFNQEIDFIVCSHESNARLIKISGGTYAEGGDSYWIGNPLVAAEISRSQVEVPAASNLPDYFSQDEINFTHNFLNYVQQGVHHGVGGAVINCLCSDYGHCYQTHANVFCWDAIIIGQDNQELRAAQNKTGMYQFGYNVCTPADRGQAIIGLYFDQSETGYIYDPIHYDDAMKISQTNISDFSKLIIDAATLIAGSERITIKSAEVPTDNT